MSISASQDVSVLQSLTPENADHIPARDIIGLYFRQMASAPLLTNEQEIYLAKRIDLGQKAGEALRDNPPSCSVGRAKLDQYVEQGRLARKQLARANTRLVISIAKRYRYLGLPLSDLIQEGNVGLMRAVDKFDHRRGNRFSTYATWWIRQAITRGLSKKGRMIRLPLQIIDSMHRIRQSERQLDQVLGRHPTMEELSERTGLSVDEIDELKSFDRQMIALEGPAGEDSDVVDTIPDDGAVSFEESVDHEMLSKALYTALDNLKPREATILRLRFGLDGFKPQTLERIGQVMNLSRERVRQIEHQAIWQLRRSPYIDLLEEFIA